MSPLGSPRGEMSPAGTPRETDGPRQPRRRDAGLLQPGDRLLLHVLVLLHAAVMATLPVAVWWLVAWAGRTGARLPRGLIPGLLVTTVLVEIWLGWRIGRIWRRLRRPEAGN